MPTPCRVPCRIAPLIITACTVTSALGRGRAAAQPATLRLPSPAQPSLAVEACA
ncbi:MAG: hypothetical protein LBQ20_03040 [Rhodanobacter sp.]|nr:hypothetical protein [Rhodanobacter sp.]